MEISGQLQAQGKKTVVPIQFEPGWALEIMWTFWRRKNVLPLAGFEPLIHQKPSHHTDYAIPASQHHMSNFIPGLEWIFPWFTF